MRRKQQLPQLSKSFFDRFADRRRADAKSLYIDMKVQSGLTEEEAIAEFGNRKELTAEILEAYHVRADYEAGQNGPEKREAKEKISLWSRVVQLWDSERRA